MRRAALLGCLAAVALAALLPSAAAASAIAEPALGGPQPSHRFVPKLILETRDGYLLTVSERQGAVALTVLRFDLDPEPSIVAASYVAHGTASATNLRASFGHLGRISMRFRPAAKTPAGPARGCHGTEVRPGVFVGTLRFRGEGGYVAVNAHRAKGTISRLCPARHRRHRGHRRPLIGTHAAAGAETPYLAALSKTATGEENFLVLKGRRAPLLFATTGADEGRISVFRVALQIGRPADFKIDGRLDSARVSGTGPFSGSATYTAAPDGSSNWEGSLAVRFPGAAKLPLTGPPLKPSVGTIPPLLALFLLRTAQRGDALTLATRTPPSLLSSFGARR